MTVNELVNTTGEYELRIFKHIDESSEVYNYIDNYSACFDDVAIDGIKIQEISFPSRNARKILKDAYGDFKVLKVIPGYEEFNNGLALLVLIKE